MMNLPKRILVIGGYGVFGARVVELLMDDPELELIVAGRSIEKANAFCKRLDAKATILSVYFDRVGNLEAQLKNINPDMVIDASGPFQKYGNTPWALIEVAINNGCHYMDLADDAEFVSKVNRYNQLAKERGVVVLSGVSSFPALTCAVLRGMESEFSSLESVTAVIAPSPHAVIGQNVVRAVVSYAGKLVKTSSRNSQPLYGLTGTRKYTIFIPGKVPLKRTLFSAIEVPEYKVLPELWPDLQSVWIGVGPRPELLHRLLNGLSKLVKWGLLPGISKLTPVMVWFNQTFQFGEHRGGMMVEVSGKGIVGEPKSMRWNMIAEGDDGPYVPAMAVQAMMNRFAQGDFPKNGARAATSELELEHYDRVFQSRKINTAMFVSNLRKNPLPVYRQIMGRAFDLLPQPLQELHDVSDKKVAAGEADIERVSGLLPYLVSEIFNFPRTGKNLPVKVVFRCNNNKEIWSRYFGDRKMMSSQEVGKGLFEGLLVERFGPFAFGMAVIEEDQKIQLVQRCWSLWGIKMPNNLAPSGHAIEYADHQGRFNFNVEICLPLIGKIVSYKGWLIPA